MKHMWMISLLTVALCYGFAPGVFSQSGPLARLAEESANISKMDWILLNTRILVLEQAQPGFPLKGNLSPSITPTSYGYDSEKEQIRISLYVDPSWLAKTGWEQVNATFSVHATAMCVAPVLAQTNNADLPTALRLMQARPVEWCAVSFFTHGLNSKGNMERKDLATFERGKLTMQGERK